MQSSGSLSQLMVWCSYSLGELCMLPGSPGLIDNIASPLAQMHSLNWYYWMVFFCLQAFFLFLSKWKISTFAWMPVLQFLLRTNLFTCRTCRGTQRNTALVWHLFSICLKYFFMTVMLVPQKQNVTLSSRLHAVWTEGGEIFVQCQWKGDLSKSKTLTDQYFFPRAEIQDRMYIIWLQY